MNIPRIVLGGTSSGVGKTSVSCGIIHALKKSGYTVQPFKVGPDYIDPGYLSLVSGMPARNLDVWLMGREAVLDAFVAGSGSDVSLIEGVMGHFDGLAGNTNHSSTHHVASILGAPAILVMDASRTARSIAATALGFKKFHRNSRIRGVILNMLGSARHERLCRDALEQLKIPVVACIPRDEGLAMGSRHLGLIPAGERSRAAVMKMAKKISEFIDVERLVHIAKSCGPLPAPAPKRSLPPKVSLGLALDDSFNFYYRGNLDALRRAGAKIIPFSPAADRRLPVCDGLYIGGGFPEIRARRLSQNTQMKKQIKEFAGDGGPVYAECGGLMYLTDSIGGSSGGHRMVGLLGGRTIMTKKMTLGYTRATAIHDNIMCKTYSRFHGHEFHYSEIGSLPADSRFAHRLSAGRGIRDGMDGLTIHNTLATYGHIYFDEANAKRLVKNCARYSRR